MKRFLLGLLLLTLAFTLHQANQNRSQSDSQTQAADKQASNHSPEQTTVETRLNHTPDHRSNSPLAKGGEKIIQLSELDHSRHLTEAINSKASGRFRFAVPREVNLSPENAGEWSREDGLSQWKLEVESRGAVSLNLGFETYKMPPGGVLTISDSRGKGTPLEFSDQDNEDHNELWTPILRTDRLLIDLKIPTEFENALALNLTKVNHGFRDANPIKEKIGNSRSQACQIDVICSAADNSNFGPLIDLYRDQISSVAAYTLLGIDTCSGVLINNARNDRRPFFLTADHCGITPQNASSMVVFWNFENSRCRTPGSAASGGNGDGPINQFNSGAIFRAASEPSDFCLVELDDAVPTQFEIYFAGWDRRDVLPSNTVAIHHPGVSEKRISFDLDSPRRTNLFRDPIAPNGTHLRIGNWEFGATEGGSSGSPLFSPAGLIVGQLHGGASACGNNLPDWYGRIFTSWNGGGSPQTRLRDWLDPESSGIEQLPGLSSIIPANISAENISESDDVNTTLAVRITLREEAAIPSTIRFRTESGSAIAGFDFLPVNEEVTFPAGSLEQTVNITILADDEPEEDETFTIFLSQGNGIGPGPQSRAEVTILNDDYILPEFNNLDPVATPAQDIFEYQITAANSPRSYRIENAPDGMTVDTDGLISWIPQEEGTFTVDLVAANPAGESTASLEIVVVQNGLIFALDLPINVPVNNSNPGFFTQNTIHQDGEDAAESRPIENNEEASFTITAEGPDLVEFAWRVDSEALYDFLIFSVDGQEISSISGQTNWEKKSVTIAEGSHLLKWTYRKDDTNASGSDRAWVDEITFAKNSGLPTIISPLQETVIMNEPYRYVIQSVDPDAMFSVSNLPEGLTFDGDRTISGVLNTFLNSDVDIIAQSSNSSVVSERLRLLISEQIKDDLDSENLTWTLEGPQSWRGQSLITHDLEDALQSGRIRHSESTSLKTEVTGPDEIAFWWRVDSEDSFDELSFKIDGQTQFAISGRRGWRRVHVPIPAGRHLLEWEYSKNAAISVGEDAGWVDEISLASERLPFFRADSNPLAIQNEPFIYAMEILNEFGEVTFSDLPTWLSWNPETLSLTGTPPVRRNYLITAQTENVVGVSTLPIILDVAAPDPRLAEALDNENIRFFNTPSSRWTASIAADREGGNEVGSGNVSDGRDSEMSTLVQGPGRLIFDWSVSSELGRDFLELRLNADLIERISGDLPWTTYSLDLPSGLHQVSWIFSRDANGRSGLNRGFIDNVRLEGYSNFLVNQALSQTGSLISDDEDGDGYNLFAEYAFSGDPRSPQTPTPPILTAGTNGTVTLSHPVPPSVSGIRFMRQQSSTLKETDWSSLNFASEPTIIMNSDESFEQVLEIPTDDLPKKFIRVFAEPNR